MNKVLMMGRLTRDPEVRYSNEGNAVSKFSLAVDRRYKREGQPDADFFNCVTFGKTAEFTEKYLKKGTKVVLEGELQNNNYTNKEGQKVYGMQIVVNSLEFAESKSSNSPDRENTQQVDSNDFMNVPDVAEEELPFA
jgi:single-strand DNA-binding protein